MSGHSKWSTIKHKKGAQDAKRAKLFSKVAKEIAVATKMGGENPEFNSRLRSAISWAKMVNMPSSNVQNAIKKSANGQSEDYETIFYEGFAPSNVAVIVECLTENRNRTATSIRTCFSKNNGNLGSSNSVRYMFENLGLFKIPRSFLSEDELLEFLIESPVKNIDSEADPDFYLVTCDGKEFGQMQTFLEEHKVPTEGGELILEAENKEWISDPKEAEKVIAFIEALEDEDDVQKVYTNLEISEEAGQALEN